MPAVGFLALAPIVAGVTAVPPCPAAQVEPAFGDATIRVELRSGRRLTAVLDPRTDQHDLWLRFERGTAAIVRPIDWAKVVRAEVAGQEVFGDELRQLVGRVREQLPPLQEAAPEAGPIVSRGPQADVPRPRAMEVDSRRVASSDESPGRAHRVCSLAVEAGPANWDADVAVDGLLLRVEPRDQHGRLVPVRALVQIELIGQRQGVVRQPQPFGRLGQWSVPVEIQDFGPLGAELRLPFQGRHPEFDTSLGPRAAVHVRLSVPGQGTFEATDAMARIRPYSSVRDAQQQATGRRFFPGESTGGR